MIYKKAGVDDLKGYIFGFVLFTLFAFLVLSSLTSVAMSNDKDLGILSEGAFDLDNYETFLESVEAEGRTQQLKFESGSPWSNIAGVVVEGIFNIGINMVVFITTPFTIISQIMVNVLGVPQIVSSVLLGLLYVSIILAIWALIKIGN